MPAPSPPALPAATPVAPSRAGRRAANPDFLHSITRAVRRDGQSCWHVALHRGGRRLDGRFADRAFGGEKEALHVARAWRDAVLAAVPALDGGVGLDGVRPRTRVRRTQGLYRVPARGAHAPRWTARAVAPGGSPRTRSFSIALHGEDKARAQAEAWLLQQLRGAETETGLGAAPGPAATPPRADQAASTLAPALALRPDTAAGRGGLHDEAFYGLARVVNACGQARWHVQLSRAGRTLQAPFPDLTYGGEMPALHVARAWRDAVLAVVPPLTNVAMRQVVRRNRRDGMPGVYFVPHRQAWKAVVSFADKRSTSRSFRVADHGEAGARALAEAERLRMLDALENGRDPALRSPVAIKAAKRDFRAGQRSDPAPETTG